MGRSTAAKFASIVAVAALALVAAPPAADAQGFPSKPVRIIVPYTPGSPNDVMVRLLAQHLQGRLGQAVVIDNKPGGGTTIGSKAAAVAPPDGYTLLFASSALVIERSSTSRSNTIRRRISRPLRSLRATPACSPSTHKCPPIRSRNLSPMPRPILASSVLVSRKGPCLNSSPNISIACTGLTSPAFRTAAARSSFPTCWAAASMSTGRRPRRCCRSFARAGSRRWPRRARNAIPTCPTCPP